jgi:hypothetical protein
MYRTSSLPMRSPKMIAQRSATGDGGPLAQSAVDLNFINGVN